MMNKKILLPSLILIIVCLSMLSIFFSGKKQIDTSSKLIEVYEEKTLLKDSVNNLNTSHIIFKKKLNQKDSLLVEQKQLILEQIKDINNKKNELKKTKVVEPIKEVIYIHDTIFITEKKNFWGKTKKTIQQSTSVDSLQFFEESDSIN